MREYDPYFVSLGLDEVNMDVTDYLVKNDMDNDDGRQDLDTIERLPITMTS